MYTLYIESKRIKLVTDLSRIRSKIRFLIEYFLMQKLYLIKDVAAQSGYSIYTLKFYLKIGLIKEVSRSPETEFRYFDDATLEFLKKIHSLRLENKSLKEIKAILKGS